MLLPRQVPKKEPLKGSELAPRPFRSDNHVPLGFYISPKYVYKVSPGCIVWLPAKERILPDAIVDRRLHENAFNHPAVILSIPSLLDHNSIVELAIVSSSTA
jgi:hypothetical protein